MANTPKKAQDATEAAMTAIQEALNVRDAKMKAAASRHPAPPPLPPLEPRRQTADHDLFMQDGNDQVVIIQQRGQTK